MRKRSLLSIAREKPRRVVQPFAAIDEFGELAERKRSAAKQARALGHRLGSWHRRKQDPAGRVNAFCEDCNRAVVVCTEAPDGMPDVYGSALKEPCGEVTR